MERKIPINPETLIWARESANILVEDVALKMKRPLSVINEWENGISSPTYVQLEKLAYEIYKRPIAVFFFPEPPQEIDPKSSFRTLPASEIQELPPTFLRLFRRAQAMQLNLEEINEGVNPAPKKILRDIAFTPDSNIREMVKTIRGYLGVDIETQISWRDTETALRAWRNIIEDSGVFVFKDGFRLDDISGFCIYDEEFPVIYANNTMPKTRQIFTLFHELTHLLLRTGGIDMKNNDAFLRRIKGGNKRIEALCNHFAGAFLVPDFDFDKIKSKVAINDEGINQLANRYKVSREVILRKWFDRHLISQEYYDKKTEAWIEEAQRRRAMHPKGGDYYNNVASYLGDHYIDLVFKKYYQGRFSAEQMAEYLGVKVSSVPGLEAAFLGRG
jgi:Zn-dependent peptidase ImmA (M78 family)/transcriptional regulator with XRE-family HTH domain